MKRSRNMGRLLAHRKGAFCGDLGFDTVVAMPLIVTTIPVVIAFPVILSSSLLIHPSSVA
jgi:hypothetical protein